MSYWLMKEEPAKYSFENLVADEKTRWDGVKNNLALKHLRAMKKGDRAVFYETGKVKSAVGVVEISRGPYPDPDQEDDRLVVVDVKAIKKLDLPVPLADVKDNKTFASCALVRIPRLSVMPLNAPEWKTLLKMAGSG